MTILRRLAQRGREGVFETLPQLLPERAISALYRRMTGGLHLAYCLHRVDDDPHRATDPVPSTQVSSATLDRFLELIGAADSPSQPKQDLPAVMMTFDDGYAGALAYVDSRADRYQNVAWKFFVCPKKMEQRVGFWWDWYEERSRQGLWGQEGASDGGDSNTHGLNDSDDASRHGKPCLDTILTPDPTAQSVATENDSPELAGMADVAPYEQATLQQCKRAAARHHNVVMGNHTNAHMPCARLSDQAAQEELTQSTADFESAFGPCEEFAFPYGVPRVHFNKSHVAQVRAAGSGQQMRVWSVEERPFTRDEWNDPDAVLPRIVLRGEWSAKRMALWACFRTWRYRQGYRRPL